MSHCVSFIDRLYNLSRLYSLYSLHSTVETLYSLYSMQPLLLPLLLSFSSLYFFLGPLFIPGVCHFSFCLSPVLCLTVCLSLSLSIPLVFSMSIHHTFCFDCPTPSPTPASPTFSVSIDKILAGVLGSACGHRNVV